MAGFRVNFRSQSVSTQVGRHILGWIRIMGVNRNKISPTIRDLLERSEPGIRVQRLGLDVTCKKVATDYETLASNFLTDPESHVFVPDTCFFTAHEIPTRFWEAILAKRVAITDSVNRELQPWLSNPRCNADVVTHIKGLSSNGPVVPAEGPEWGSHRLLTRQYYTTLLSSRKDRAIELVKEFTTRHGHAPSKVEQQQLLQSNFVDRELKTALKAVERGCDISWWTDEYLVASALQIAAMSGVSTSILTRDRDVLDQFARLCALVNMDYQAFMFGERFTADPSEFPCLPCPRDSVIETFFDIPSSALLKKPVAAEQFTEWVLPNDYRPVHVSCVLLGGPANELTAQVITYNAEEQMDQLMVTKGKTLGWNVELSGDRNCRVTGLPETIESNREFIFVGKDRWKPGPGTPMRWAELDCYHAIHEVGKYTRIDRKVALIPVLESDSVEQMAKQFVAALAPFVPARPSGPHSRFCEHVTAWGDEIGDPVGAKCLAKVFAGLADDLLLGAIPIDANEIAKAVTKVTHTAFHMIPPDYLVEWTAIYKERISPYINLVLSNPAPKTRIQYADVFRAVSYGLELSAVKAA